MQLFVTALQAMSQLYECRQKLDKAMTEKSNLESDVARLSKECAEVVANLHTVEVSCSHLVFTLSSVVGL